MNIDPVQQAMTIAKAGDAARAKSLMADLVAKEPDNARAWYFLAQLNPPAQAVGCLEEVLRIDPGNAKARERLKQVRAEIQQAQQAWNQREAEISKLQKQAKGWNFAANAYLIIFVIIPVVITVICLIVFLVAFNSP